MAESNKTCPDWNFRSDLSLTLKWPKNDFRQKYRRLVSCEKGSVFNWCLYFQSDVKLLVESKKVTFKIIWLIFDPKNGQKIAFGRQKQFSTSKAHLESSQNIETQIQYLFAKFSGSFYCFWPKTVLER